MLFLTIVVALLVTSTSIKANPVNIENPQFVNRVDGTSLKQLINIGFGWFRTLDNEQKQAYYSSIVMALEDAQPGQFSRWYMNNASGTVRVAWQEPRDGGICKRLQISIIAYDMQKNMQTTACFNDVDNRWTWYN